MDEFGRVSQAVGDQAVGVCVGKGVDHMLTFPFAADDVFRAKNAQTLGDGCHGVPTGLHQIPDTGRSLRQGCQQPEA